MPETKETFELLVNYLEHIPIGLMLFSPERKILSWNRYVLELLGISNDDCKKNDFGLINTQIINILETKKNIDSELIGLSRLIKVKKVEADDKNIVLILSEGQQESIGEMSHELRRPITNIKTLTESLLLGAKNDPDISKKFLEQINVEVDRLTRLVNELINLSKIRSGKLSQEKKKLNLKPKVDEAIQSLHSQIEKNKIKITNEIQGDYQIFADSEQIEHVIQNLLENAIKYSKEGASINIKPGPSPGSFQVDDTGIGIPESEISKIFDRFYRVDRTKAKGSSGLGLAIVKNVIDLHGGKIEVKSVVDKGSTFIIFLPSN